MCPSRLRSTCPPRTLKHGRLQWGVLQRGQLYFAAARAHTMHTRGEEPCIKKNTTTIFLRFMTRGGSVVRGPASPLAPHG